MKNLFLDANAHVPLSIPAQQAYIKFQNSDGGRGHPSSPSKAGQLAANALETARSQIAILLGAKPSQIIFTSTCSQACEWALNILINKITKLSYSPVEHSSIKYCIDYLKTKHKSVTFNKLNITKDGVVSPATDGSVVCVHVQNELGTIQPIEQFQNTKLLTDMCQSIGKVPINLETSPADIAVFGGHKFGGSAGLGFIFLKNIKWYQEFGTGSRYYNDRPGTPDVGAAVATAAALEDVLLNMPERTDRAKEFQSTLEPRLEEMGLEIIGKGAPRVSNTTFVHVPNIAMHILLDLSNQGVIVGLGSACGSMHTGPSPLMKALGREGGAHDFIRISQHGEYGKTEALYLADIFNKSLKQYRRK